VRNVNKRLTQAINLINDLYKLSQNQAKAIAEFTDDSSSSLKFEKSFGEGKEANMPINKGLLKAAVSEVKSALSDDRTNIDDRAIQLVHERTNEIEHRILALENQTLQLQQDSPELKMYSRANQLVKDGARIEDVMEATQLPRAEVEVLVGLHGHKKKPN